MKPEGYFPRLFTLCNHKLAVFHLDDEYLCTSKLLPPPGDNGEILEAAANEEGVTLDVQYKIEALNGHQRPPKAPYPNLNKCKYHVLVTWVTG